MIADISSVHPDIALVAGEAAEESTSSAVAKMWQVPGFKGKVGFITTMSDHFCSTCNRLRLTADGNIKVCLFGRQEISLRDALRSDLPPEEVNDIIAAAVWNKKEAHDGMTSDELVSNTLRPMTTIGG
jgi:cyclic pyranopterin phosphate synthase